MTPFTLKATQVTDQLLGNETRVNDFHGGDQHTHNGGPGAELIEQPASQIALSRLAPTGLGIRHYIFICILDFLVSKAVQLNESATIYSTKRKEESG